MRHLLTLALILCAGIAYADCSTPAGKAGSMFFNSTYKVMQYCNGTDWMNTGPVIANAAQTGCTTPVGQAGTMFYNSTQGLIQFCNGSKWVDTACAMNRNPGGTGCTSPTAPRGTMRFDNATKEMQFCDSTDWIAMGYPCEPKIDWTKAVQLQKYVPADGLASDYAGWSIGISGNTAIVGAYGDDNAGAYPFGAAYILQRSGGVWSQQAKLNTTSSTTDDRFGYSVAVAGDIAVIGAYLDDTKAANTGAAYIFTRSGTTWTQETRLVPSDGLANDNFSLSVAVYGNTAVIGSPANDAKASNAGAVYVYTRSGTTWTLQQKILAADGVASDAFGTAVGISGDTLVVAANGDDDKGTDSGSLYIYTRSGSTWTQQGKVVATDGTAFDNLGLTGVSIDRDTIVVGVWGRDDAGASSGGAYVFKRTGTTWAQQAKLIPYDGAAGDYYGNSAAVYGDTIVVGSPGDDDFGGESGSAYIYTRNGSGWTLRKKVNATDAAGNDMFGAFVAMSYDNAFISSWQDSDKGTYSGSAYFFGVP